MVASQGGRYTKHIYIGSQRIVSKLGDLQSYGADPRRIPYAGSETDNINIDYKEKYSAQQQSIKDNYATFEVPYNGKDNDNYVDGGGFCCDDQPRMRSITPGQNDSYEGAQFYYHPDHLGSSSFITNLDGDVTQHIEYVPFGEVFIEERNNVWNTPYLFNAKELDEETGLYYYGARYYDSRISLWLSTDPKENKYPNISSYVFCANNPVKFIDIEGEDIVITGKQNTSITLKTDLIDIKVNASSLGVNFEGNYTLDGDDVLSAALDIVGIVDPSGIADGINATLQAKRGKWLDAIISAAGVVPYVGDAAKVGKIKKDINIIETAIDAVRAGGKQVQSYKSLISQIQKHHLIPKAIYKKYVNELSGFIARDASKNLKKLPNKFHGNHPAYSNWINKKIENLSSRGALNEASVNKLLNEARQEINKAYDVFKKSNGKINMNDYFKNLD